MRNVPAPSAQTQYERDRRAPATSATGRAPSAAESLALTLQRGVGNRAAALLLRSHPDNRAEPMLAVALASRPRTLAASARTLQRFGVTVTTIHGHGGGLLIDKVQIGDRPPGLFGAAHKSHSISWETFCDGLRLEIMRQPLDTALARVEALYQFVLNLPGMARAGNLPQANPPVPPPGHAAPDSPMQRHARAVQRALAAHNAATPMLATPAHFTVDQMLAALQEFAAAYLQLRNSVPLAAVDLPHPSGGAALNTIRAYETQVAVAAPVALRRALWAHLDVRVVARLAAATTTARQAPGIDSNAAGAAVDAERCARVRDVVRAHLASMRASYPAASRTPSWAIPRACRPTCSRSPGRTAQGHRAALVPERVDRAARRCDYWPRSAWPGDGPRSSRQPRRRDPGKRFAVQLITGPVPGGVGIIGMHVGGRPIGVFGQEHGSHTTAWSALADRVRALVLNRTVAQARASLLAAAAPIRAGIPPRIAAMPDPTFVQDAQLAYNTAVALTAPVPDLVRLQAIARGILMLLNTEPFAAVQTGGPANPAAESQHRQRYVLPTSPVSCSPAPPAMRSGPICGDCSTPARSMSSSTRTGPRRRSRVPSLANRARIERLT